MKPEDYLKYLTPKLEVMLSIFGILLILIIGSIIALVSLRNKPFVQKIIWNIKQLRDLLSNKPSYYSQKRIKSSVAFYSGLFLIIGYDIIHFHTMSASEIGAHALILFGVAGYHVSKTQEEKLNNTTDDSTNPVVLPIVTTPIVNGSAGVSNQSTPLPANEPPIPDPPVLNG
jgi:hypothetical protein